MITIPTDDEWAEIVKSPPRPCSSVDEFRREYMLNPKEDVPQDAVRPNDL